MTPVWNGGGTVKLTIIASDYTVPTTTLIEKVQKEIDSVAPIGHIVTVDGTTQKEIQNTKINGNAENLILESNFIPVRGSVTDGA